MIRAVVFDFGGVLSRFGARGDHVQRIANTLGVDTAEVGTTLNPLVVDWMSGKTPTDAFWKQAAVKVGVTFADYESKWLSSEPYKYEREYYDFAAALRHEGYVTAVFSNVNPSSALMIRSAGGYSGFAPVVLSPEIGACKPDPAAYKALLEILKLPGDEVMLIDDMPENCAAARKFGIHAVQAYDPTTTMKHVLVELVAAQDTKRPASSGSSRVL
jgi:putative hydrolase of the HAD superfamily